MMTTGVARSSVFLTVDINLHASFFDLFLFSLRGGYR
jgi:hypothetical protein